MLDADGPGLQHVWRDACEKRRDWSGALTSSLAPTGSRALLLCRVHVNGGRFQLLGASAGAPIEFVNLCRQFGADVWMGGTQQRHVAGVGRVAWSAVTTGDASVVLFGLYSEAADLPGLSHVALLSEKCVTEREAGRG